MLRKCILPTIVLILSLLCSCTASPANPTSSPDPSPTPELTGNVFLDSEEHFRPTGVEDRPLRVFISVSKEDALSSSAEDYATFLAERVERSKNLDLYTSYTLLFDDGTGIIYYGCDPINSEYGAIDAEGSEILDPLGTICPNDDGTYSYIDFSEDSAGSSDNYDVEIEKLLSNAFTSTNMDVVSLTVSVENREANVSLTMPNISYLFVNAERFADSAETWDELLQTLTKIQISVMDTCKTLDYGEYTFVLYIFDHGVRYATIEDGAITFNQADSLR